MEVRTILIVNKIIKFNQYKFYLHYIKIYNVNKIGNNFNLNLRL